MPLLNPPLHLPGQDVTASRLRSMMAGVRPGVDLPGDLVVSPGTGLAVTVKAGVAYVDDGATSRRPTVYRCELHGAAETVPLTTAHTSLPRVDQVIAEVLDPDVSGSSAVWRLRVLAGTATSGATLDNRTGAAVLPARCLRLADVLVPAASASIVAGNVRDRRSTAGASTVANMIYRGADIAMTTSGSTAIHATLQARVEVTAGDLVRCTQGGRVNVAAGAPAVFAPHVNGAEATDAMGRVYHSVPAGVTYGSVHALFDLTLPAGSHVIAMGGGYATPGTSLNGEGIAFTVERFRA